MDRGCLIGISLVLGITNVFVIGLGPPRNDVCCIKCTRLEIDLRDHSSQRGLNKEGEVSRFKNDFFIAVAVEIGNVDVNSGSLFGLIKQAIGVDKRRIICVAKIGKIRSAEDTVPVGIVTLRAENFGLGARSITSMFGKCP